MPAERFFRPFFGLVGAPIAMRSMILTELSAPHRRWHGLLHHALMLRAIMRGGHDADDRRRLVLATLFHDIMYDARRTDNEEASAEAARRWLAPADAGAVAALILATKAHDLDADPVTCALLMADLGVLWTSSAALYAFYARGIRAEYAHVPDAAYRTGRAAVLRTLREGLAGRLAPAQAQALDCNLLGEIAGLERGAFDLA